MEPNLSFKQKYTEIGRLSIELLAKEDTKRIGILVQRAERFLRYTAIKQNDPVWKCCENSSGI